MISAAEQSKCYRFAQLHEPKQLIEALGASSESNLFFDPTGSSFKEIIVPFLSDPPSTFTMLIGPEGDLTTGEKKQVVDHNFSFISLTPTILRARQAAFATAVIIRSIFK